MRNNTCVLGQCRPRHPNLARADLVAVYSAHRHPGALLPHLGPPDPAKHGRMATRHPLRQSASASASLPYLTFRSSQMMDIGVIDVETCEPIEGALVDIWHANSTGHYAGHPDPAPHLVNEEPAPSGPRKGLLSAFPRSNFDDEWLRAAWPTNKNGVAQFSSIFPGCESASPLSTEQLLILSPRRLHRSRDSCPRQGSPRLDRQPERHVLLRCDPVHWPVLRRRRDQRRGRQDVALQHQPDRRAPPSPLTLLFPA